MLPQPIRVPEYWVTLLNYIGLYSIVAIGLVLLTGIGGMTSFGQAAFVGVGAYATAYLTTQFGVSPWLALIAGVVLTALIALLLGLVTMRLSGHFLPLGTIAWGLSLFFLFGNLEMLGKYDGINGIPVLNRVRLAPGIGSQHLLPDLGRRAAVRWCLFRICLIAGRDARFARCAAAARWPRRWASIPRGCAS